MWAWGALAVLWLVLAIESTVRGEPSWPRFAGAAVTAACAAMALGQRRRELRRVPPAPELLDAVRPEVVAVAAGGTGQDEVRAIRLLRERTGLGLLEARETVTRWLREQDRTHER